jgi:hypothetical protein
VFWGASTRLRELLYLSSVFLHGCDHNIECYVCQYIFLLFLADRNFLLDNHNNKCYLLAVKIKLQEVTNGFHF